MRRPVATLLVLAATGLLTAPALEACGAKFMVALRSARGVTNARAAEPARILVYQFDAEESDIARSLESKLRKVGHMVTVATTPDEFLRALDPELVVAIMDFDTAEGVAVDIDTRAPNAAVLPWIRLATQAQRSEAVDKYGRFLKLPATTAEVLSTVEESYGDD